MWEVDQKFDILLQFLKIWAILWSEHHGLRRDLSTIVYLTASLPFLCINIVFFFQDIEATIAARKCPTPYQFLKWMAHLLIHIFYFFVLIAGVACIAGVVFVIGFLFSLGNPASIIGGFFVIFVVILIFFVNGYCNYFAKDYF